MKSFLSFLKEFDNSFIKWAESNNMDLTAIVEDTYRTGVRAVYPDGYVRSQYPDAYFPPMTATAALDLQNSKKTVSVPARDGTPG